VNIDTEPVTADDGCGRAASTGGPEQREFVIPVARWTP
jgi:hypothetical protein